MIIWNYSYHFDMQWASSTTIVHTRLDTRGFSSASLHLVCARASGENYTDALQVFLSSNKLLVDNAASPWATGDNYSLDTSLP